MRRRDRLELQRRIQAIINESSADARLCADNPDSHVPLADRLVDLVAEEVARVGPYAAAWRDLAADMGRRSARGSKIANAVLDTMGRTMSRQGRGAE